MEAEHISWSVSITDRFSLAAADLGVVIADAMSQLSCTRFLSTRIQTGPRSYAKALKS